MRFWITKNSELSIREQLVRQVVLGILSEDLPAGHKLPSVRALARRHHIHANTVSAAYHDLLQQGWLVSRSGSGVYVRTTQGANSEGLDNLLTVFLQSAQSHGYSPEEVFARMEHLLRPQIYERILIVEPEAAMRDILRAELQENLDAAIETVAAPDFKDTSSRTGTVVVALPTRAAKLRSALPASVLCLTLRLRSIPSSLQGETKPGPDIVISIVSQSPEIRDWARAMLIAVGLDPVALCDVDSASPDWKGRIGRGSLVVTDIVTAREMPPGCMVKQFRVVADSSITELINLCTLKV